MIDTHAHLNHEKLYSDSHALIKNALKENVKVIVNIGSDIESSLKAITLAKKHKNLYAVVGFHPHEAKKFGPKQAKQIKKMASDKNVVAIGEIGLDFHYNFSSISKQKKVFKKQIKLAYKLNLPIVIHSRNASKEVLEILTKNKKFLTCGGIIHCFGEDSSLAKKYIDLGFYLGIGGLVTFKNCKLKQTIKEIGLDRVVLETDCPYLAPEPFREKVNTPANLKYVCEFIGSLLQISAKEVAYKTSQNAKRVYKL